MASDGASADDGHPDLALSPAFSESASSYSTSSSIVARSVSYSSSESSYFHHTNPLRGDPSVREFRGWPVATSSCSATDTETLSILDEGGDEVEEEEEEERDCIGDDCGMRMREHVEDEDDDDDDDKRKIKISPAALAMAAPDGATNAKNLGSIRALVRLFCRSRHSSSSRDADSNRGGRNIIHHVFEMHGLEPGFEVQQSL
jgi:hypothetical protein